MFGRRVQNGKASARRRRRGADSRAEQAQGKKTMELELAKKASSSFRQLNDEWVPENWPS
jgi:hypothetical protein